MTDHTCTEKIDGDSIYFYGHPSRARNPYDKFQDGLHVSIRDRLTTLDTNDFNKWVNMAIKAEQNLKEMKHID